MHFEIILGESRILALQKTPQISFDHSKYKHSLVCCQTLNQQTLKFIRQLILLLIQKKECSETLFLLVVCQVTSLQLVSYSRSSLTITSVFQQPCIQLASPRIWPLHYFLSCDIDMSSPDIHVDDGLQLSTSQLHGKGKWMAKAESIHLVLTASVILALGGASTMWVEEIVRLYPFHWLEAPGEERLDSHSLKVAMQTDPQRT